MIKSLSYPSQIPFPQSRVSWSEGKCRCGLLFWWGLCISRVIKQRELTGHTHLLSTTCCCEQYCSLLPAPGTPHLAWWVFSG